MLLQAPKPLFANMFCQSLDPSLYRKVQTFLLRSSFAFTNIYIYIYLYYEIGFTFGRKQKHILRASDGSHDA